MVRYLQVVTATFAVGLLAIAGVPSAASFVVGTGVAANVALALAVGVALGWRSAWLYVVPTAALGLTVVLSGTAALVLFFGASSGVTQALGVAGGVAAYGAVVGLPVMLCLVAAGALAGASSRAADGCAARRRRWTRRSRRARAQLA
jgi:hypothetical protein